jgi:alpha-N-arabinofuranosidase
MTSPSDSTLANLRRQNGREEPWKIEYFAIGNESWGCGGNMTPAYYTDLYKHYATFLKSPADNTPELIASGGNTGQTHWTEALITKVHGSDARMNGIGHHYYTLPSGDWSKPKGPALDFAEDEWFSTLRNTLRIEKFIIDNVALLDEHDPEGTVGLYMDEWGTWYDPATGTNPGFLWQQNSLRDGVLASLNLNIFHEYARRVRMSNIAQMINVLQAMILTDKEKMLLTPTYHVFHMYVPFQDATFIPLELESDDTYAFGDDSIAKVSASSAIGTDGKLYVALTNTHPEEAETVTVDTGNDARNATGNQLTHREMDAHNTFEEPENIMPAEVSYALQNGVLEISLPAKSVTVLKFE